METISNSQRPKHRPRHRINPFLTSAPRTALVYHPNEYQLATICGLSARALRVFVIIAAKYDARTGMSHAPKKDIQKFFSTIPVNISHATAELIDANLVARGLKVDTYYLNEKVFKPINIDF